MKLLHIDSSPQGALSVSRRLTQEVVDRVTEREPGIEVIRRDLASDPVPHLSQGAAGVVARGEVDSDEQRLVAGRSESLVQELHDADLIVIGSPMYNFGIASQLKAWFDYVIRAGKTFGYGEKGPVGLLAGKRAIVVESRGGVYSAGPMAAFDHQEPYLKTVLGFIGVTDVQFIRAEGLAMGLESRERGIATAQGEIDRIFQDERALAA